MTLPVHIALSSSENVGERNISQIQHHHLYRVATCEELTADVYCDKSSWKDDGGRL